MPILLNNVNVDSESPVFKSAGGVAIVNVRASSLGGGTVVLSLASTNDASERFIPMTNGMLTDEATLKLEYLPAGLILKAALVGSTAASNVFVDILQ